jgi:serine/threonine protein kinase
METLETQGMKTLLAGEKFGRYLIVRQIGSGGMAAVYEALHTDLQKRVALKVLHPCFSLRNDIVQRFVIEARAASRLAHPHVVSVYDIGVEQAMPFLAMDLLEGQDLASLSQTQSELPLERIADIFLPILSALAAAHEAGILHRDIKPENIFIARRPPREHPVLLDFGISKLDAGASVQSITTSAEIVGTPAFVAPEVATGGMSRFDARSDQYSIGVTLYVVATGHAPFDADTVPALLGSIAVGGARPPSVLRHSLPPAFDALVLKTMALAPEDRFTSIRALGHALLPFASDVGRSLWSADFPQYGANRSTMQFVPFRVADARVIRALDNVSDTDIERAVALGKLATVSKGTSIFVQGTRAESCFLLISGQVEVTKTQGADTYDLGRLGPGAIMGLAALWEESSRPVSIIATEQSTVLEISQDAFKTIAKTCPAVADSLLYEALALAADRVSRTNRKSLIPAAPDHDKHREFLVRLSAAIREWSILPSRSESS